MERIEIQVAPHRAWLRVSHVVLPELDVRVPVLLQKELLDDLAFEVPWRVAQDLPNVPVGSPDHAILVDDEHGIGRRLEDAPKSVRHLRVMV